MFRMLYVLFLPRYSLYSVQITVTTSIFSNSYHFFLLTTHKSFLAPFKNTASTIVTLLCNMPPELTFLFFNARHWSPYPQPFLLSPASGNHHLLSTKRFHGILQCFPSPEICLLVDFLVLFFCLAFLNLFIWIYNFIFIWIFKSPI